MTLIELMTVLSIIAILAAIALPNLSDAMATQRLRAAGTDLISSLLLARSEAIKRNAQVVVAPQAAGDWTAGWRVATVGADEQVDKKDPLGARVAVALAPASIVYGRNGRLTSVLGTRVEFRDSEGRPGVDPRCVTVDSSGLPRLSAGACP
jgi:type IV fimbrial biogenesis protein FimT